VEGRKVGGGKARRRESGGRRKAGKPGSREAEKESRESRRYLESNKGTHIPYFLRKS
jgi:hypothetical protein